MRTAVISPRVFDGQSMLADHAVLYDDSLILAVVPVESVPADFDVIDLKTGVLAPGFLDLQVNGGGGQLLNNAPHPETMEFMAAAHGRCGVARIMPTLISDAPEVIRRLVDAWRQHPKDTTSGLLGLHVEGPFFSAARRGVHQSRFLRPLAREDWHWIETLAQGPAILTLAPERLAPDDIRRISQLGIRVCAGHTAASFEQMVTASEAGLTGITHLFNAMEPLQARVPGVAAAALTRPELYSGIIADGHHVHDAMLNLARQSCRDRLFLVSDAMATVGSDDTAFTLYGETIVERAGVLQSEEGRLAGSAISLADAVRYAVHTLHWPVEEVLAMATRVPALFMGLNHQVGSLRTGNLSDLTWLDDQMTVAGLWRAGKRVF